MPRIAMGSENETHAIAAAMGRLFIGGYSLLVIYILSKRWCKVAWDNTEAVESGVLRDLKAPIMGRKGCARLHQSKGTEGL